MSDTLNGKEANKNLMSNKVFKYALEELVGTLTSIEGNMLSNRNLSKILKQIATVIVISYAIGKKNGKEGEV